MVILHLVPNLFGTPLANIRLFQPDFGMALTATAVTGVLWAVFRLGVAYTPTDLVLPGERVPTEQIGLSPVWGGRPA